LLLERRDNQELELLKESLGNKLWNGSRENSMELSIDKYLKGISYVQYFNLNK
jgi:hypothetical protein